mgnify:FL=1
MTHPESELNDGQLLGELRGPQGQKAFAEIVRRHLDLVYHTALRRVGGDRQLAEDIAQQVFADLARKAASLATRPTLAGWLYRSTRFAAAQTVRTEQRRKFHEQESYAMNEINHAAAPDWNRLRPVIDDVLDDLNEAERDVILLRYFENLPLAAVGEKLSVSADAARMRVDRAIEKLRSALAKRGIASTSTALAGAIAGQAQVTAPVGLAAAVIAHAFAPAGVISMVAVAATKGVPLSLAKIFAVGAIGATAIGFAVKTLVKMDPEPTRGISAAPVQALVSNDVLKTSPQEVTELNDPLPGPEGLGEKMGVTAQAETPNGEARVERLARLVGLDSDQRIKALAVFQRENAALWEFPSAKERLDKGAGFRQKSRSDIRALLTPAQLKIYDGTAQRLGGGAIQDPAAITSRIDQVVSLSDEQTRQIAALYQRQADALMRLSAEEREGGGGAIISQATRIHVRATLTAEQQKKFDANPTSADALEARAVATTLIASSPAMAARWGSPFQLSPAGGKITVAHGNGDSQLTKGIHLYRVKGRTASETIRVYWEKSSASAPIHVSKIEGSNGEPIMP